MEELDDALSFFLPLGQVLKFSGKVDHEQGEHDVVAHVKHPVVPKELAERSHAVVVVSAGLLQEVVLVLAIFVVIVLPVIVRPLREEQHFFAQVVVQFGACLVRHIQVEAPSSVHESLLHRVLQKVLVVFWQLALFGHRRFCNGFGRAEEVPAEEMNLTFLKPLDLIQFLIERLVLEIDVIFDVHGGNCFEATKGKPSGVLHLQ